MRHDVLIIGAGLSGLFAAAELARHGVEARLIEQEIRPHREARATAIQPGTPIMREDGAALGIASRPSARLLPHHDQGGRVTVQTRGATLVVHRGVGEADAAPARTSGGL